MISVEGKKFNQCPSLSLDWPGRKGAGLEFLLEVAANEEKPTSGEAVPGATET